jgi:hypothetical protein
MNPYKSKILNNKSTLPMNKFKSNYKNLNKSTFINNVLLYDIVKEEESSYFTGASTDNKDKKNNEICTQFPLFIRKNNIIKIPSKVEYVIRRYVAKKLLDTIHPDRNVAVELCLLFLTELTSTYFDKLDDPNSEGWKSLHAEYIRDFLSVNPMTYKHVTTALKEATSKGAILECDEDRIIGKKNYYYRLGEGYIGKGIVCYKIKTSVAQSLLNKNRLRILNQSNSNPIFKNLLQFYKDITLPSIDEIEKEGDRLIALKHKTKKRKLLKRLGNHNKSYFKNPKKYSFIEDSIKIFKYLTDDGITIPKIGGIKNGGRITDIFTLMPSWIRKMIKFKEQELVECDYSCLHPNIVIKLYGGSKEYLTHAQLAITMQTDVDSIKVEHLSFFNKKVWQMKESILYNYYKENEPIMIQNVIAEKYKSELKHNVTSRRLFEKEVQIMTDVITILNQEDIYVGYVYDALLSHPKDANRVKEVMDGVAIKHGIKTTAKLSNEKKVNTIQDAIKVINTDIETTKTKPIEIKEERIFVEFKNLNFNVSIKEMLLEKMAKGEELNFVDATVEYGKDDTLPDRVLKIYDQWSPNRCYVSESHLLAPKIEIKRNHT